MTHHQKVLFIRADLRFPDSTFPKTQWESDHTINDVKTNGGVISHFQNALKYRINAYVARHNKSLTIVHSLWVGEIGTEHEYHYPVVIAVNVNTFLRLNGEGNLSHMIR